MSNETENDSPAYVTPEGIKLEPYSSMYCDWGLAITLLKNEEGEEEELYNCPSCLSAESYGSYPPQDEYGNYDESLPGEWEEWTPAVWRETLKSEADDLIEGFCGWDIWDRLREKGVNV